MNAYVDSSILIRLLFGQPNRLAQWSAITRAISSELVRVECLRTIDRTAIRGELAAETVAQSRSAALDLVDRLVLVPVSSVILGRAAEPFPTSLGTLDAIHLATALQASPEFGPLVVLTHDGELALAARSVGFEVDGV